MRSLKILILFLCLIPTSFGFVKNESSQVDKAFRTEAKIQNDFPNMFRPVINIFKKIFGIKPKLIIEDGAFVTNLSLSRNELNAICPTIQSYCSTDMKIEVSTLAIDPENDVLLYVYSISGGRIIGSGSKVIWDLSGVAPGTYTITAGVDDSCGVCGQTQTKTVKVIECPDCR